MTGPFRMALEVWGNDYRQIVDTAVAAEDLGFAAFYYGESPHSLNLETWTVLAGLAERTRSIRLGPVIANLLPAYRSFRLFVRQVHALAVVSGGRLDVRTGTGASAAWARPWWEPAGVDYPDGATRRAVLAEWLSGYDHFEQLGLEPAVERPPLTVAAMGDQAMTLAARHADVWEASYLDPEGFAALARGFDDLAAGCGRTVARSLEVDVVTAPGETDRRRLEERFRAERGEAGPEALARALRGPADAVTEQLDAYAAAGADQVVVACVDPHHLPSLETLAEAARSLAR